MSSPLPGTSPWITATVASPSVSGSHGTASGQQQGRGDQGGQRARRATRRLAAALDDDPGEQGAAEREHEAHADGADPRQRVGQRGVGDGEGQPAPRHPAERPGAEPQLGGHPRGRDPQRPEPVPLEHGSTARPRTAKKSDCQRASPIQASVPTARIQKSSTNWKPTPKASPGSQARRGAQAAGGQHEARDRERDDEGRGHRLEREGRARRRDARATRIRSSTVPTIPRTATDHVVDGVPGRIPRPSDQSDLRPAAGAAAVV